MGVGTEQGEHPMNGGVGGGGGGSGGGGGGGETQTDDQSPLLYDYGSGSGGGGGGGGGGVSSSDGVVTARGVVVPPEWRRRLNVASFVASVGIGGFLFGYDTGVISGALPYIREDLHDVKTNLWLEQLVVSSTVAAAALGAAAGGWVSDAVGRRGVLVRADVLFIVGALAMALAPDSATLIAGRALVGLGVGAASVVAPLFIAEASPSAHLRASLVSMEVLLITLGQLAAYFVNYLLVINLAEVAADAGNCDGRRLIRLLPRYPARLQTHLLQPSQIRQLLKSTQLFCAFV